MVIVTPEKWDVVTRKHRRNGSMRNVRLIIFDEVHMLNSERGPVLESIAVRTFRQVISDRRKTRRAMLILCHLGEETEDEDPCRRPVRYLA